MLPSRKFQKCPSGKIYNEKTGRCVNKNGAVGKAIQAGTVSELYKKKGKKRKSPKPLPEKSKKLPKKKREHAVLPVGFELLPDETIWQLLLELDSKNLKSACATNLRINAICSDAGFQREWKGMRKSEESIRPGQPMIFDDNRDHLISYVITSVIDKRFFKAARYKFPPSGEITTEKLKELDKKARIFGAYVGYLRFEYNKKDKRYVLVESIHINQPVLFTTSSPIATHTY